MNSNLRPKGYRNPEYYCLKEDMIIKYEQEFWRLKIKDLHEKSYIGTRCDEHGKIKSSVSVLDFAIIPMEKIDSCSPGYKKILYAILNKTRYVC